MTNEKLAHITEDLIDLVYAELESKETKDLDTHELGKVIDMIKDLEEAMYHCTLICKQDTAAK